MKREQFLKHWKVMEAFKNGKTIQYKNGEGTWQNALVDPMFTESVEYRIKPEAKVEPFTMADMSILAGKIVLEIASGTGYAITAVAYGSVKIDDLWITYTGLLQMYTFADGSPCGKVVE
jgi:hypothetical protein